MFVAGATLPVWILSLLAALLFDQAFRGRDILKAAFFLPVLPPIVVVAVVWRDAAASERRDDLAYRRTLGHDRNPLAGRCACSRHCR